MQREPNVWPQGSERGVSIVPEESGVWRARVQIEQVDGGEGSVVERFGGGIEELEREEPERGVDVGGGGVGVMLLSLELLSSVVDHG
jgi:hypothetical protein